MAADDSKDRVRAAGGFDLAGLASAAQPREVTSATFSYVDAMLTGRMSEADLARIREDLLGAPTPTPDDPAVARIEGLIASGDDVGGLRACEALLEREPGHAKARRLAEQCAQRLGDLYLGHLGSSSDVPRLAVPTAMLGQHGVDRWAAYLISRFDDQCSIEDLVQLTGLSRLDTLRLLYELFQRGVIAIDRMPPPSGRSPQHRESTVLARVKLKSIPG